MNSLKNKILYIDPLLQNGHVNFNNIYIKYLNKSGYQLEYVFVKGYENKLNLGNGKVVYSIPNFLFKKNLGKLGNRLSYFFALLLIKFSVDFKKYDYVIFSSFEEISFFLAKIKGSYLINHINVSTTYASQTKFSFLNKVLLKNSLIVLDKEIENYLNLKGNYKIHVLPHGLPNPKSLNRVFKEDSDEYIFDTLIKYSKILFSPSETSSDKIFINELIESSKFMEYLKDKDILFVYKDNLNTSKSNVLVINSYLSENVYNHLFLKSDIIFIAYPDSFKYRVSGVLLECMANNKACVVSRIDTLESYSNFFRYNAFFSNIDELIQTINNLDKFSHNTSTYYKNLEVLEPNFNKLFN